MSISKKYFLLAVFACCCFSLFSSNYAQSFLSVKGKEIIDRNGNPIILRGIGLGGWLVPEGYQLHIPGFGSPSSIEKLITDLIGESNAEEFYSKYYENYVSAEDIQKVASWNFNSIRLPFNYRLLTPDDQPGVFLESGFRIIDDLLTWCENNQLYLILDLHCAPGGQNKDNISDSDGIEARLWTNEANQTRTIELWKKIAERYANEEWIGGYDLLNEPVLPQGYNNSHLRSLYIKLTQAIREVDKNHIIFIEGNWYATDFAQLTPPFDNKSIYSFHKYWNENNLASIQPYLSIRNSYHVPLWLGESGENSNSWFYDAVQLCESNKIGWCWWTHKKIKTTTSPYSAPITPDYQVILNYWNGQRTKPTVDFAKAALLEMADKLQTQFCEFRPDVLKALLTADFGVKPASFSEHKIPGTINCVDYDFGRQSIAYFDKDFQNSQGLGSGATWNKGGEYRNDGVDIELCSDAGGAKYNIGWIENEEWIKYTVQVEETGIYDINLRIASPNSSGKIQLFLNDQALTSSVSVTNTQGWKTWQTISITNIEIPSGSFILKLSFPLGGFNIEYLQFRLKTSLEEGNNNSSKPDKIVLKQNYPNPFFLHAGTIVSTKIGFICKEIGIMDLSIHNVLGQKIYSDLMAVDLIGTSEFIWDGKNLFGNLVDSGVYFYTVSKTNQKLEVKQTRKMIVL